MAGVIEFDMTFLKDVIKAQPAILPAKMPFWKISALLRIFISGRNLRYEVHLPGGDDRVHGMGQICIAAAFLPGTE